MVDTLPAGVAGTTSENSATPWLIPLPLPPPIDEVERRLAVGRGSGNLKGEVKGIDLHPGAPEYLWAVARTKRPDGRDSAHHLRPMEAQTSIFSGADGSCKMMQGNTCIVAAVTGPAASSLRRTTILSKAFCEVLVRPRTGTSTQCEKRLECELQNIVQHAVNVQLYPRTTLQVVVQVVGEDGPLLSTCANAVCMALLDAGVNLRYTFAAVCVASRPIRIKEDNEVNGFLLDPTTDELSFCSGAVCLVYDVCAGGLVSSSVEQDLLLVTRRETDDLIRLGYSAATSIKDFFRRHMKDSLTKIATTVKAQNWYSSDV